MTEKIKKAFEAYLAAQNALNGARSQLQAAVTLFFRSELTQAELLTYSTKCDAAESAMDLAARTYRYSHTTLEAA